MDPQQLTTTPAAPGAVSTPVTPTQGVFPARSTEGMPAINNIAPLARPWHTIFSVAAVFIALIALFITYFLDVRYTAQTKRDAAQAASIQTAMTDPALQQTEQQVNQYAAALAGYQVAVGNQHDYSKLLSEIDQRLPKDAVLDSINIDDKGAVRIVGRVSSFEQAAKTYESYKQSTMLTSVNLNDVSLSQSNSQQVNFTISGTIQFETPKTTSESEGL